MFSIERAIAAPSQRAFQLKGVTPASTVDQFTFDINLPSPEAVLPEKLTMLPMMNTAWAVKSGVEKARALLTAEERISIRFARGQASARVIKE